MLLLAQNSNGFVRVNMIVSSVHYNNNDSWADEHHTENEKNK